MKAKQKRLLTISYMAVIFFMVLYVALNKHVSNLDEIWNFNIAKEIVKGNIPYKDISLITTPLFYYIAAIPLKLIANELIVYRVLEAVIITVMLYLTFKIFQKINKNEFIPYVLLSIMCLFIKQILALNYNFLVVLWVLIIINLEISKLNKNKIWYNLVIGLLAGVAILTKQTAGAFIALFSVILVILDCNSKKELKQSIKNIAFRILGIMIPVAIFVIYLLIINSLNDFISYTILSISTFNNKIGIARYFNSSEFKFKAIQIGLYGLAIVGIVYELIIRILNRKPCRVVKLINYAIPLMILIYPIADDEHFVLGFFVWAIIGLIEIANILEKAKDTAKSKILDFLISFLVIFVTLLSMYKIAFEIYTNMKQYNEAQKNNEFKYYKELIVSDGIKERVKTCSDLYEKYKSEGKELVILDAEAAPYLLPTDSYRKNYDMFNKGNFGKDGEQGIIDQIKNDTNKVYLVKQENIALNWQTPIDVIKYVRANLDKKGSVLYFDIYEK